MEQNELPSKITALYCRTATPDPAAIEKQREELLLYAAAHSFENVQIFEDDGFSGLSDARPDFTRMNELIAARRVARVLTQKISRISRNIDAMLAWARMTQKHGVKVITLDLGSMSELFVTMQDIYRIALETGNSI